MEAQAGPSPGFSSPLLIWSVNRTTNKHHITDADLVHLRGNYKPLAAQAQTLSRLNDQKPDEVVERYLSKATAILPADEVHQIGSDE